MLLVCVVLLSAAIDVAQSSGTDLPQVPTGLTVHNVIRTWSEALSQCQREGATLASPINDQLLKEMQSLIGVTNAMYYIGTTAQQHPGQFVSLEGVPVENMTSSLWQQLDPWSGDCLSMTTHKLHVVPCDTRLPYICYKPDVFAREKTNCGAGYKYDVPTKHCYKVHPELVSWHKAQRTCVAEGANLVVIDNDIEAKSIKSIYGSDSFIWTGLLDVTGKGDWTSVHWQPVENLFNTWFNGVKLTDGRSPFGVFYMSGNLKGGTSGGTVDFICEKEPID